METKITQLKCLRCSHTWTPRTAVVRQCPSCKSAWFDTPKPTTEEQKRSQRMIRSEISRVAKELAETNNERKYGKKHRAKRK